MRQCNKCGYEEKCDHKKCPRCGKGCMRLMKRCNVCFRYFPNGKLAEHMQKHHKQERMVYVVLEEPEKELGLSSVSVFHHAEDALNLVMPTIKHYRSAIRGVGWPHVAIDFYTPKSGIIPDSAVLDNLLTGNEVRVAGWFSILPEKVR